MLVLMLSEAHYNKIKPCLYSSPSHAKWLIWLDGNMISVHV